MEGSYGYNVQDDICFQVQISIWWRNGPVTSQKFNFYAEGSSLSWLAQWILAQTFRKMFLLCTKDNAQCSDSQALGSECTSFLPSSFPPLCRLEWRKEGGQLILSRCNRTCSWTGLPNLHRWVICRFESKRNSIWTCWLSIEWSRQDFLHQHLQLG